MVALHEGQQQLQATPGAVSAPGVKIRRVVSAIASNVQGIERCGVLFHCETCDDASCNVTMHRAGRQFSCVCSCGYILVLLLVLRRPSFMAVEFLR